MNRGFFTWLHGLGREQENYKIRPATGDDGKLWVAESLKGIVTFREDRAGPSSQPAATAAVVEASAPRRRPRPASESDSESDDDFQ